MKSQFQRATGIAAIALSPVPANAQLFKKSPEKLDTKIIKAGERLDVIQANPETRIPSQVLSNAIGIIIVHQFKAGIGIGAQGGGGVAMVKNPQTGRWSPPAFVANAEGSYGWQIGAQNADTVYLIMQDEGMNMLRQSGLKFGVDVRATAGPATAGGEASVDAVKTPILVYSDQAGLFAGVAIEGGGIIPAQKNNVTYYGLSMQEVLFGNRARMTATGQQLVNKLMRYTNARAAQPAPAANPNLQPYQPNATGQPVGVPGQYQPAPQTNMPEVPNPPRATPVAPGQPAATSAPVTYPPISEVAPPVSGNPVTEP